MVYRIAVRVYWPLWDDISLAHDSSFLPGEKCSLVTESERALLCNPTSFMWTLRTIRLGYKTVLVLGWQSISKLLDLREFFPWEMQVPFRCATVKRWMAAIDTSSSSVVAKAISCCYIVAFLVVSKLRICSVWTTDKLLLSNLEVTQYSQNTLYWCCLYEKEATPLDLARRSNYIWIGSKMQKEKGFLGHPVHGSVPRRSPSSCWSTGITGIKGIRMKIAPATLEYCLLLFWEQVNIDSSPCSN